MALMMGKLHAALAAAGVTAEGTRDAAEEAASYKNRLAGVETRLVMIEGSLSTLKILVALELTLNVVILGVLLQGNGL